MIAIKDAIIAQALTLDESERLEIIQKLSDSIGDFADTDASMAWDAEIDRRLDAIDAGTAKFLPWAEARRRIAGDVDASHS